MATDNGFMMQMAPICIDLDAGAKIAILHEEDAKEMGLIQNERIEIFFPKKKKRTTAIVNTTNTMVKRKEIGLFSDIIHELKMNKCTKKDKVNVKVAEKPESLEFIKKKLRNEKLTVDEIRQIVEDIGKGFLSSIELSAFMSAVYIHGFDLDETVAMTRALIENGHSLKLEKGPILDKHCVGGINGRTTMLVVPIIASQGLYIPKTSSRSITSAAGTADSMEVLASVTHSIEKIKKITEKHGGIITWGGAVDLAPVDDHIIKIEHPLSLDPEGQVVASVMAKKASVGSQYVVIDLPVGPTVKVKSRDRAKRMAMKFISVGKQLGMKVEAVITDGTEPSGKAFGPMLEAKYVMEILEGQFFDNLAQKSCELAGTLFEMVGKSKKGKGFALAKEILVSGKALSKMKKIIKAQGGKITKSSMLKMPKFKKIVLATEEGKISKINVRALSHLARRAGAPYHKKSGVLLDVEEGDVVKKGRPLMTIYSENKEKLGLAYKFYLKNNPIELERIILEKFE